MSDALYSENINTSSQIGLILGRTGNNEINESQQCVQSTSHTLTAVLKKNGTGTTVQFYL